MSLKPGGLAFVTKSTPNNQHLCGRVVTTLYQDVDGRWLCEGNLFCYGDRAPWRGEVNGSRVLFPAEWLKPIDGDEGDDETLTWAGKPSDIKTPEAA